MRTNRRTFFKKGVFLGAGLSLGSVLLTKEDSEESVNQTSFDIFKVMASRRSVRKFKSISVPKEHITKILEAANFAPSPRNRQAWKFLVLQNRNILDQIKEECIKRGGEKSRQYFTDYLSAPVYIVVLANTKTRNPANDITAGALAAQNLILAARALGYGSVFCVNSIPEEVTKKVLKTPDEYQRICIIPIGIPVEWPKMKQKKSLKEVVMYGPFE
jgi:nitroreductase